MSSYTLDLDLRSNAPHVHRAEKLPNAEHWHGTEISVMIRGAWSAYKSKIIKYLRQLAIITPYADVSFRFNSESGGKRADVGLRFRRRTGHMPPPPQETTYHPSAGARGGCARVCALRAVCFARLSVLCSALCARSQPRDDSVAHARHEHQDRARLPLQRRARYASPSHNRPSHLHSHSASPVHAAQSSPASTAASQTGCLRSAGTASPLAATRARSPQRK